MNIYDKTITILNKLKSSDSSTGLDVYYKTVLPNCGWYTEAISDVNGNTALISTVIKIFIPFNDSFLDYSDWRKAGSQDGHFTMSTDDIIILGDVEEDVTIENIYDIKNKYEPNVCEVRFFRVCDRRDGVNVSVMLQVQGV